MEGIKMQKVLISHIGKKSYADSDTSLIRKNNLSYDPYKYVSEAGHEIDLKQFIK